MTSKLLLSRFGVLLLAACLAAPLARAIVLDFSVQGVGTWDPASAYNNDAAVAVAANKLVTWYNGGTNPNPDPNAVFGLNVGGPAPALPGSLVFGYKDELGPFDSFNPANYSYVVGKYGNAAYLFYIGNLAPGTYTLPAFLGDANNTLSHEVLLTASRTSVPDGGTTMALLGFSLLCMEGLRRKLKLA